MYFSDASQIEEISINKIDHEKQRASEWQSGYASGCNPELCEFDSHFDLKFNSSVRPDYFDLIIELFALQTHEM